MYLTHLSLTNFRNFSRLDIDVPGGTILVVGDNAQGKTSLLESIYYLATLDSFHASLDRQVVNFLAAREPLAVARIVGSFEKGSKLHRLEVRIIQESNGYNGSARVRKEVLLNEVKLKSSAAVGQFKAVLFLPQMLHVVDGSPDERRRFLNLVLAQVVSHYAANLAEYNRVLGQRNALLKQLAERQGDAGQLEYWDDLIADSGAQLIQARIRAIQELERLAVRYHQELTQSIEVLRLSYQPAFDPLPKVPGQYLLPVDTPVDRSGMTLEQIRQGFKEKLLQLRSEEIARGITACGPHRDELRFLSNRVDLGDYGSRGQIRTAMLAFKLAEVAWIKQKTGHDPVLLLDEVLAELDPQRRMDLLSRLSAVDQSLLTTTDLDLFSPDFIKKSTCWQVTGGRLLENPPQEFDKSNINPIPSS
jgi:DNA replication and repair protein RecF